VENLAEQAEDRARTGRETGVWLYQVFAEWLWKSIAGKAIPGFIHGLI
jgi:hypothetical protein